MRTFQSYCLISVAIMLAAQFGASLSAQAPPQIAADGYITAVRPAGFDVDGKHVVIQTSTNYRLIGNDAVTSTVPYHAPLYIGEYVQVIGSMDRHTRSLVAVEVRQRNDWCRTLSGSGVITRELAGGAEPVFEADGYRIRVTAQTAVAFADPLKSLADVTTNCWIAYEGKRDKGGDLVATRLAFLPSKSAFSKALKYSGTYDFEFAAARSSKRETVDNATEPSLEGGLVQFTPFGKGYRIPADDALQQRVQRIGESLVPEYQKKLPPNDPSKIRFRFYAVDDDKARTEFCSLNGVILIPTQAVDRLGTDDRVAALLADGIAVDLQRQKARVAEQNLRFLAVDAAGDVAGAFVPGLNLIPVAGGLAAARIKSEMEEERGRVALALMAAAGYDPWQAPEAWRLLAPKKLPADLDTLKYPDLSGYQFEILHFQYSNSPAESQANAGSLSQSPAQKQ